MVPIDSARLALDLSRVALRLPFLTAGIVLSQLACMWFFLELAMAHPWLLVAAGACTCFTLQACLSVATGGLLAGMPEIVHRALLERTFFEVFRQVIGTLVYAGATVMQLVILAVADLDEQRTRDIMEEMDPAFRRRAFQQPMLMMLPVSLRLLVLGPFHDASTGALTDMPKRKAKVDSKVDEKLKENDSVPQLSVSMDELVSLVRNPEHAPPTISKPLQQAFTGVVTDTAMSAIKMGGMHQAGVTRDQVHSMVSSAQEKVAETSVSVAKGTISGGARGGGAGLVSGSVIGAACGLIPAVFTFGLSIPIGAALGGGTGLVVGSSVGATAGAIGSIVGGKDATPAIEEAEQQEEKAHPSNDESGNKAAS
jgi:hypothetical protein